MKSFASDIGSGANVVCLRLACRPWEAAICAAGAHVNVLGTRYTPEEIAALAEMAHGAPYLRKQSLQLASKGRFLAAQFVAMFDGDPQARHDELPSEQ